MRKRPAFLIERKLKISPIASIFHNHKHSEKNQTKHSDVDDQWIFIKPYDYVHSTVAVGASSSYLMLLSTDIRPDT
jgi:hypothetical protein